jgi:hypothetical protein
MYLSVTNYLQSAMMLTFILQWKSVLRRIRFQVAVCHGENFEQLLCVAYVFKLSQAILTCTWQVPHLSLCRVGYQLY